MAVRLSDEVVRRLTVGYNASYLAAPNSSYDLYVIGTTYGTSYGSFDTVTIRNTSATAHLTFSRKGSYNYVFFPSDENSVLCFTAGSTNAANRMLIIDNNSTEPNVRPGDGTNLISLGRSSGNRWKAVYIGTDNSYGNAGQCIYWNAGVPKAIDWHIGNSSVGEHNANNITYNMIGYYTSNGPIKATNGATTDDGAIYVQAYNASWVGQIAQDYRNGNLFVRSKNNGTWMPWKTIVPADNDFTINPAANIRYNPIARTWTKTTTTDDAWDTGLTSKAAWKEARITFQISQTNKAIMLGFTAASSTVSYTDINYSLYCTNGGKLRIYWLNTDKGEIGSYAANDEFVLEAVDKEFRVYKNGVRIYRTARTETGLLYFDSSWHGKNCVIKNLVYEPIIEHYTHTLIPSSWIDGQRYGYTPALNVYDYANKDSYNPWIRATNTYSSGTDTNKVGRWFSFGTLGTKFYWIGSLTSRTANSYDYGMNLDISRGQLRIESAATTTSNQTGALILSSAEKGSNGNISFELWRGANASWQFANEGGVLYIRSNWTTALQTTYNKTSMEFQLNSGTVKIYNSLLTGNLTIGGVVDTDAGKTIASNSTLYLKTTNSSSIIFYTSNTARARFDTSGYLRPEVTRQIYLGTSSYYWNGAYIHGAGNIHWNNLVTLNDQVIYTTDTNRGLPRVLMSNDLNIQGRGSKFWGMSPPSILVEITSNNSTWTTNNNLTIAQKRSITNGAFFNGANSGVNGLTADAGSGNTQTIAAKYGQRITLDFTKENRTGWVECYLIYVYCRDQTCTLTLDRYNQSSGTWTVIDTRDITGNGYHVIYPNVAMEMYGASSASTARRANKFRATLIVKTASSPSNRYAPHIGLIAGFGSGIPGHTRNATYTSADGTTNHEDGGTNTISGRLFDITVAQHGIPFYLDDRSTGGGIMPMSYLYLYGTGGFFNANVEHFADLYLGNSANVTGANAHAEGRILIYSANTHYHAIRGAGTTAHRWHYLPNTTGWIACGGNGSTTGVGDGTHPTFLGTNGVIAQCTYALGGTLNGGTASRMAYYSGNNAISSASITSDGSYLRNIGGYNNTSYALSTASFICNSWVRTKGSTGWYNEDYGGGWFMQDTTWIRAYSNKSVYTTGQIYGGDTWGSNVRMVSNWVGFYSAALNTTTRYGYMQINSTKCYFRKENGADWLPFDFNGAIYTNGNGIHAQHGHIFTVGGNEFNWIPDSYNSTMWFNYESWSRNASSTISKYLCGNGKHGYADLYAAHVQNAVWNDFAEYREGTTTEAGRVVAATASSNKVAPTFERLQPCAHVISDTFGCSVGQSDTAQTPLGVSGRVLVYPYQPCENYHVGDCVCAAPNGTADIMTREEIMYYPDRIIGVVDEIPDYTIWNQVLTTDKEKGGSGKVETNIVVDGRIWIYVR